MNLMSHANLTAAAVLASLALVATPASAQSSGVDAALFRPTIDTTGVFSLEGARLMPRRDIAWKFLVGYAQKPFRTAVPGIGGGDDTGDDAHVERAGEALGDRAAVVDVAERP